MLDEINKEEEKQKTNQEDAEKPTDNEKVNLSEKAEETIKPIKEEKKSEITNSTKNKANMQNPTRTKADQKGSKNVKTGVTGSALVAGLGLSSLFASLTLRKKED